MLKVLSEPAHRRILVSTIRHSMAVGDIGRDMNIPLSTAYKFVHELVEAGLMTIERTLMTDDGKRYDMYRSLVREVRLSFESDRMVIDLTPNEDTADRFFGLWSSLRKGML